uniref:NADH-ubiquinone oxidoreductase chain 6 n=1 Tax=Pantala flavescens TaxID=185825 RepID=A0A7T3QNW2_PANFL|nr:NADH dehydrogenase subunit 6 [Pantala flavescens]QPQ74970.1 NADH dehydrogenase subunit 6 [Pantala flavescens]QPZ75911.1 NADH dehydrogenase subunit 6 [Pantala flavescens]UPX00830.1 NADH dehydrogenase subunit 6 [Pantala flavescens]
MSQILSVMLMIMNSFLFSSMSHPMNMGITLLLQTIMMCILMSSMSYTSWFSYILFLVFLGGMLVLFIYMTSIASNEMFKKSSYFMSFIALSFTFIIIIALSMDLFMVTTPVTEMFLSDTTAKKFVMTPLYNNPSSLITTFMVMYLFLTLIVIVSITKFNQGPLRPMN